MALISCLECKAEISDKAKSCPKCGAPAMVEQINRKPKKMTVAGLFGRSILISLGFLLLMGPASFLVGAAFFVIGILIMVGRKANGET